MNKNIIGIIVVAIIVIVGVLAVIYAPSIESPVVDNRVWTGEYDSKGIKIHEGDTVIARPLFPSVDGTYPKDENLSQGKVVQMGDEYPGGWQVEQDKFRYYTLVGKGEVWMIIQ